MSEIIDWADVDRRMFKIMYAYHEEFWNFTSQACCLVLLPLHMLSEWFRPIDWWLCLKFVPVQRMASWAWALELQ